MDKVSVGILSYNRPALLIRAVKSLINQTYKNLDIHISDNGSNCENMQAVLASIADMDDRIRITTHAVNKGPHFNFRFVMENAIGDYFVYLCDDDYFVSDYIESCINGFKQHPSIVLSGAMPLMTNEKDEITTVKIKFIPQTLNLNTIQKYKLIIDYLFYDDNFFYYGLIKTDAIRKSTLYLDHIAYASDSFLIIQLIEKGDFYINTSRNGLVYTRHENQTSTSLRKYKEVLTTGANKNASRFFFTKALFLFYFYVFKINKLSFLEKLKSCKYYTKNFIATGRHNLLKYDLGIENTVFKIRKFLKQ
jgi:glycosyltransferase involved in cell wall biosynthesis